MLQNLASANVFLKDHMLKDHMDHMLKDHMDHMDHMTPKPQLKPQPEAHNLTPKPQLKPQPEAHNLEAHSLKKSPKPQLKPQPMITTKKNLNHNQVHNNASILPLRGLISMRKHLQ